MFGKIYPEMEYKPPLQLGTGKNLIKRFTEKKNLFCKLTAVTNTLNA